MKSLLQASGFKIFTLFFVLIHNTQNYAQSSTVQDTILAGQYYQKADSLLTNQNFKESLSLFDKALPLYEKAKAWRRVVNCYNKTTKCKLRLGTINHQAILKNTNEIFEIINTNSLQNSYEEANTYLILGTYYLESANLEKAEFNLKKAIETGSISIHQNDVFFASCYTNLGIIYWRLGKFEDAIDQLKKALKVDSSAPEPNPMYLISSIRTIGSIYQNIGDYKNALKYYKDCITIISENNLENHIQVASTYNQLGRVYELLRQYDKALIFHKKALSMFTKLNLLRNLVPSYRNIGVIYYYKGESNKAINYFNKSLEVALKTYDKEHPEIAHIYVNIAATIKNEKALAYYYKALAIYKKVYGETHWRTAEPHLFIGAYHRDQKEYDIAVKNYQKNIEINTKSLGPDNIVHIKAYRHMGDLYFTKKEYDSSLAYFQKSIDVLQQNNIKENLEVFEFYIKIGNVHHKQQKYARAIASYDKALDVNKKTKDNEPKNFDPDDFYNQRLLLHTLLGKGKSLRSLYANTNQANYLDQTLDIYQNADQLIDHTRQTYQNYEDKVAFAEKAKELYNDAIQVNLLFYKNTQEEKYLSKAFYYAEKSKANTLKELLNDSYAKNFSGLSEELLEIERTLRTDRSFYQSQLISERSNQNSDSVKIKKYENELFTLDRKQDSVLYILKNDHPQYYHLKHQNHIASAEEIQKQLDPQTTLLEFFTSDSTTYAFTITKNDLSVIQLDTPSLEKNIQTFRQTIINKNLDQHQTQGHQLYQILIAPIKDKLQGNRLIVIPDGPLWRLNFDLLLSSTITTTKNTITHPKDYPLLLKEYAISYANSANLLFDQEYSTPIQKELKPECLAFSFSNTADTITNSLISFRNLRSANTDLPGTRKEIASISDIIDGQYYYGANATEANFKKSAGPYNMLHLALHGEVDNDRPENSRLFFTKSKDSIEDNFLYTHELFALDIPAELTVLSACNTGSGKIAKGEGIMSLGNAFQYAGTKSLLLTNWAVSDETTPTLMKKFYANLKEGMPKDKALQQAKLSYLNSEEHYYLGEPFYWGGFYLIGDTAPITFSSNNWVYWYMIIGILALIFIVFLIRRRKTKKQRYNSNSLH